MKKNWHRVPRGVLVGVLVALLLTGVVLAAVIYKHIPGTITVIAPASLEVFWDEGCSDPVTSITVGTIMVNETKTIAVRVKNTGEQVFTGVTATCDVDPSVATFSSTTIESLGIGENDGMDLVFTGKGQGSKSFTVTFEGTFSG